jgi:hypothetical protein
MRTSRRLFLLSTIGISSFTTGCAEWVKPSNEQKTSFTNDERSSIETTSQPKTTRTPEYTTLSEGTHDLPDGPKSPPEPPETWNESTAEAYVIEYEKRHIYNSLYSSRVEKINTSCGVVKVEAINVGYRVVVLCEGVAYLEDADYHGDYIGKRITYLVSEGTAIRLEPGVNATTTER